MPRTWRCCSAFVASLRFGSSCWLACGRFCGSRGRRPTTFWHYASDDEFLCGICGATFASAGGVATHRMRQHPETAAGPLMLRQSVVGTCCPVCGRDYRLRLRILHHLRAMRGRDAGPCRAQVLTGHFSIYDEQTVEAADLADRLHRRACRRHGVHILAGPPCRGEGDGGGDGVASE